MLRLSPVQVELAAAISDGCEVAQSAGWLPDTEYWVWLLLHDPRPEWGIAGISELTPLLELVGAAVIEAGCWIAWPDGAEQAHAVSLGEWTQRFERWRRGHSGG
jgi:hypothetical protein